MSTSSSGLYRAARLARDVNAVRRGPRAVLKRQVRKIVRRHVGRLLQRHGL